MYNYWWDRTDTRACVSRYDQSVMINELPVKDKGRNDSLHKLQAHVCGSVSAHPVLPHHKNETGN